jgi:hypothetical protein
MRQLTYLLLFLLLYSCSATPPQQDDTSLHRIHGGPYIIYNEDETVELINFDFALNRFSQHFDSRDHIGLIRVGTQEGNYEFSLRLHDNITIPAVHYDMPERILVISDPHGDVVSFITGLQGNGAIDEHLNWIFGSGHLVVLGDVHNRGDDVTAIFWLIYKLEEQAREAGGAVHFFLGNHEVMVVQNDHRYTTAKYDKIAERMGVEHYGALWNDKTELGRWLQSRNTMITIGDILFVHAGVSPELAATDLSITQINDIVRKYMALPRTATADPSTIAHLIMRSNGPLWYRGMVLSNEYLNETVVDEILERFGVRKIIVGHTILPEISSLFDGRVIATKVNTRRNLARGGSRGLMITPNDMWAVDNNGRRMEMIR